MNWYQYLDPRFRIREARIRARDRVVTNCPRCGVTEIVTVSNLKQKIKRRGDYVCFPCAAKEGFLKSNEKRRNTYLKRFGVPNPMQAPGIARKAFKTSQERYGEGGAAALARAAKAKKAETT